MGPSRLLARTATPLPPAQQKVGRVPQGPRLYTFLQKFLRPFHIHMYSIRHIRKRRGKLTSNELAAPAAPERAEPHSRRREKHSPRRDSCLRCRSSSAMKVSACPCLQAPHPLPFQPNLHHGELVSESTCMTLALVPPLQVGPCIGRLHAR